MFILVLETCHELPRERFVRRSRPLEQNTVAASEASVISSEKKNNQARNRSRSSF